MIKTKISSRLIKDVNKKYALWRTDGDIIVLANKIFKGILTGIILHTKNPKYSVGYYGDFDIDDFEPFDGKISIENDKNNSNLPKLVSKKHSFFSLSSKKVHIFVNNIINDKYNGFIIRSEDFKYEPYFYGEFDIKDFKDSIDTITIRNEIL